MYYDSSQKPNNQWDLSIKFFLSITPTKLKVTEKFSTLSVRPIDGVDLYDGRF